MSSSAQTDADGARTQIVLSSGFCPRCNAMNLPDAPLSNLHPEPKPKLKAEVKREPKPSRGDAVTSSKNARPVAWFLNTSLKREATLRRNARTHATKAKQEPKLDKQLNQLCAQLHQLLATLHHQPPPSPPRATLLHPQVDQVKSDAVDKAEQHPPAAALAVEGGGWLGVVGVLVVLLFWLLRWRRQARASFGPVGVQPVWELTEVKRWCTAELVAIAARGLEPTDADAHKPWCNHLIHLASLHLLQATT